MLDDNSQTDPSLQRPSNIKGSLSNTVSSDVSSKKNLFIRKENRQVDLHCSGRIHFKSSKLCMFIPHRIVSGRKNFKIILLSQLKTSLKEECAGSENF